MCHSTSFLDKFARCADSVLDLPRSLVAGLARHRCEATPEVSEDQGSLTDFPRMLHLEQIDCFP